MFSALRSDAGCSTSNCIVLKKGYQCWIHDATRQSLIMTALDVFRVGIFVTLKTVKQLSLSDLQVTRQLFLILAAWGSRVCPSLSAMRGLEHSFI